MAGNSATLTVKVLTDASGAQKGIDQAQSTVGKFQSGISKLTPAALAVGGGLVVMGKQAVDAASELQQAQGSVESVYGSAAGAVEQYASTSADRLGLAASEYMNYSSLVGSALQNAGFSAQKAADMSDKAMTRGADMAATFGGSTADAVDAINAAVSRGEYDSLEKYGVSLNKTAIDAELAKRGQDDLTGAALKNATAQATLDMIYEQTGKAAGQFGREADTAAGQQQRATAAFTDASAELGGALLPIVTQVTQKFTQMVNWIAQNKTAALTLAGIIGGLAAAVLALNVALKAYNVTMKIAKAVQTAFKAAALGTRIQLMALTVAQTAARVATVAWNAITKVAAAVQRAFNAVMRANPIGLVITAIMLLIGAIVLLWNKNAAFRNFVKAVWAAIANFATAAWNAIKNAAAAVLNWIKARFNAVKAFIAGAWKAISNAARSAFQAIRSVVASVLNWIRSRFAAIRSFIAGVWRGIQSAARSAFNGIRSIVSSVVNAIRSAFRSVGSAVRSVWSGIRSAASSAFSGIRGIVSNVVSSIRAAFNGVRTAVSSVWSSIRSAATSALNAILSPIRAVKSAFDNVISVVQRAIDWIGRIRFPSLPSWLPGVGGPLPSFDTTPAVAYSPLTPFAAGGLGAGTPASRSGGGNTIININGAIDPVGVARQVGRVIRTDSRRRAGVTIDSRRRRATGVAG